MEIKTNSMLLEWQMSNLHNLSLMVPSKSICKVVVWYKPSKHLHVQSQQ